MNKISDNTILKEFNRKRKIKRSSDIKNLIASNSNINVK